MKRLLLLILIGVAFSLIIPSQIALADTASCGKCIEDRMTAISGQTSACIVAAGRDAAIAARCADTDQASRMDVSKFCESSCSTTNVAPIQAGATAPAPTVNTTSSYASNPITLLNPLNTNDPRVLVGRLIQAIIGISGGIALVMFIYSGLLFLTAAGETSQVSKAKNLMIQVILGIIIIAAAFVVTNTLFNAVLTGNAVIGSGAPNKPL